MNDWSAKEKAAHLFSGANQSIGQDEVAKKLAEGKRLVVKAGFDPTSSSLHIGHAVVLRKLKECALAGHDVVFVVGDFTARIGDPTGRVKSRPALSNQQIDENSEDYMKQAQTILGNVPIRLERNTQWFNQLGADGLLRLASQATLAQVFARDDFRTRHEQGASIGLNELIYPLLQGQDSVELKVDIEVGGNDQWLNMLMGRQLQKQAGLSQQAVIAMPLICGIDGFEKMGKSLNNHIPLIGDSFDAFGKLMSTRDDVFFKMLPLLGIPLALRAAECLAECQSGANPMTIKLQAAFELVEVLSGTVLASAAQSRFVSQFSKRESSAEAADFLCPQGTLIASALKASGLCKSSTEARRLIEQGAVKVDGILLEDTKASLGAESILVQIGSRRAVHLVVQS